MKPRPLPPNLHRDTLALHTSLERSQYGEHSEALYLTSGFVQPDAETSAHRFANPQEGYTYGRTSNPTVTSFERRLAAMEGVAEKHERDLSLAVDQVVDLAAPGTAERVDVPKASKDERQ